MSTVMNGLLAEVFGLYLKTENYRWHLGGPHFQACHALLDQQAAQLYALTDLLAESIRRLGGTAVQSLGQIARMQRVLDQNTHHVDPSEMLAELGADNLALAGRLRAAHAPCAARGDSTTAEQLERWIGESERRARLLQQS